VGCFIIKYIKNIMKIVMSRKMTRFKHAAFLLGLGILASVVRT